MPVVLALLALLCSSRLKGQEEPPSIEERLRALETQNRRMLELLDRSRDRNLQLETELGRLREEQRQREREELLEPEIDRLTHRSLESVRWRDLTRSGKPIQLYGFVRLDAYYNTGRASDPVIPFIVLDEDAPSVERNDDQFALDARLTRFGLVVDAGTLGDAHLSGRLEIDFANFPPGVPESRATPRIRLAHVQLAFGEIAFRLGQDWDIIAPLHPAVHSELLLWGAGNLGDRRPMVQLIWQTGHPDGLLFTLEAAAGLTGAIDAFDLDGAGRRTDVDGFDSGHPHGQLRLGFDFGSWQEGERVALGAWGYVAGLESDGEFGGEDHFTPWAVGLDWSLPLIGPLSTRGELWVGQALGDVRGSILQHVNAVDGEEIASHGGWAELHVQVSEALRLAVGGSLDDPRSGDLAFPTAELPGATRDLNWTLYLSSRYDWSSGLVTGLDIIWWETRYLGEGQGNMVRINFYTQLDF